LPNKFALYLKYWHYFWSLWNKYFIIQILFRFSETF